MIRIAWKIDGKSGFGEWFNPTSPINTYIKKLNEKYGENTHWIEYAKS